MDDFGTLCHFVTAANIAGILECKGEIEIFDDEELTRFIEDQYGMFLVNCLDKTPQWTDWVEDALIRHYMTDEKLIRKIAMAPNRDIEWFLGCQISGDILEEFEVIAQEILDNLSDKEREECIEKFMDTKL